MSKIKPITIIVGGQYGSEGKGAVTGHICRTEHADYCVRTGGPNAGHTVHYNGRAYAMQQLPVGWVNPDTHLVIGAGALVNKAILEREIATATEATGRSIWRRLFVDHRAFIHEDSDSDISHASGRPNRLGSTGKGCSVALRRRIERGDDAHQIGGHWAQEWRLVDTESLLNQAVDQGAKVVIEGTQGVLLDLCLGPYPYTTHRQTGPAQWMMECGLSPSLPTDIVMVLRTYPIRVAGNSGPLPHEIDWTTLARDINRMNVQAGMEPLVDPEAIAAYDGEMARMGYVRGNHKWGDNLDALRNGPTEAFSTLSYDHREAWSHLIERTTVTKKIRRIASLDEHVTRLAGRQVRPHRLAVMFMDYLFPAGPTADTAPFLAKVSEWGRAPVAYTGWGPNDLRPANDDSTGD